MTQHSDPTRFDFGKAISQPFQTSEGRHFTWRLVFWGGGALAVLCLILAPILGPVYLDLMEYNWLNFRAIMSDGPAPDEDLLLSSLSGIWPFVLILSLAMWCTYAATEAALHRKILLGREHAKRPLMFGQDEITVMLSQIVVYFIWMFVYTLGVVILVLFVELFGALSPVLGGLVATAGFIALFCLIIYVPVRLAPMAANSVMNGELRIRDSIDITRKRFWPLFGAYVVVLIFGYIAMNVLASLGLLLVTGNDDALLAMSGLSEQNPREIFAATGERMKNPVIVLPAVVCLFVYALVNMTWAMCIAGIGAYAVKWQRIN